MVTRAAFLSEESHRIRFVYIPKHTSWLNQIECWFSIWARGWLRRSSFYSTSELKQKILNFIDYFNCTLARPCCWKFQGFERGWLTRFRFMLILAQASNSMPIIFSLAIRPFILQVRSHFWVFHLRKKASLLLVTYFSHPVLEVVESEIAQVSGHRAYAQRKCYSQASHRGAKLTIPPPKNIVIWHLGNCKSPPHTRYENLREIRRVGYKKWKRERR